MEFGEVAVDEASGAILAHSVSLGAKRLRKGVVLGQEELDQLRAAKIDRVTVARLGPEDVHEDEAAADLARAMVGGASGLRAGPASTGRVNLFAEGPGIVEIKPHRIDALNAVHPMITVATVPQWQRMSEGGMVATVKIISYGAPRGVVSQACQAGVGALKLRKPAIREASFLQTVGPGEDGLKGEAALKTRLDRLGVTLLAPQLLAHEIGPLADALKRSSGEIIFILTSSATSDIQDTAPKAVRQAGGEVMHFGMPVDPGNLLFIGEIHGSPVIGLPGCARSPALNGADWVLERILCGIEIGPAEIMKMGVGGLLKEIPSRPKPRL